MGFQQGLSGLNAASKSLDSIGNNVANANTVGFKSSQTQFADVYANSLTGASYRVNDVSAKAADRKLAPVRAAVMIVRSAKDKVAPAGGVWFRRKFSSNSI